MISFDNIDWEFLASAFIIFLICVWVYVLLWVAKDISQRTENFSLQLISILLILFLTPIVGLPLYYLLRPLTYGHKEDGFVFQKGNVQCYHCHANNKESFRYCVFCGKLLKYACHKCKKPIGIEYVYCPWCGACVSKQVQNPE